MPDNSRILLIAAVFVSFLIIGTYVDTDRLYAAYGMIIAIGCAIWGRWDLKNQIWFWIFIGLVSIVHCWVFYMIEWKFNYHPSIVYIPMGLIDCAIIISCVFGLEWLINRDRTTI
jgi:hypothetical protein